MRGMSATWAVVALLVVGAALRVVQYSSDASLWLDELALARAVVSSHLSALLTQPLPFDQVAPKGFLLLQKLAVLTFGANDHALRLVPFLCSLAALAGFAMLVRRALPSVAAVAAVTFFATAAPLVAFAGSAKQYSMDVLAAVVLASLALDLLTRPVSRPTAWRAAVAGAVLPWFSQPGVLMVAALGWPLMIWLSADPPAERRRYTAIILVSWGVSAAIVTVVALTSMTPATREYMRLYWADGFASWARVVAFDWPWTNLRMLFASSPGSYAGLSYPLFPFYPALAAVGAVVLWRRHRRVALVCLSPIAVTLAAAAAGQYPFGDRLVLFLLPFICITMAVAIDAVYRAVSPWSRPLALTAAIVMTLPAISPTASALPPYSVENLKPVLAHVQARKQAGDRIYVYYAAAPVVSMYDEDFGLARGMYAVGGCHRGNSRRYLDELDAFRGSARVWVIFTHSLVTYREQEDMVAYLEAIGRRLDHIRVPSHTAGWSLLPSEAFLFDLSEPARLASADAQSFALTGPVTVNPRNTCERGPAAMIQPDF